MLNIVLPPDVPLCKWLTFLEKTTITPTGCIEWNGCANGDGYGYFHFEGDRILAHRQAYIWAYGEIPEGQEIHHVCENPACVNPRHLRAVTHRENVLLGNSPTAKQARQTHCHKGHPLDGENLLANKYGHRHCKACRREWYYSDIEATRAYFREAMRKHNAKKRAALIEAARA